MYRAFTLIDVLTALAISVMILYFFSPLYIQIPSALLLQNEVSAFHAFIYRVQAKARYDQQNYTLSIAQKNQQWCAIAIAKKGTKQTACNCFYLNQCHIERDYFLYQNQSEKVNIKTTRQYPKVFTNISGTTGKLTENCIAFLINTQQSVLQLNENGVIDVIAQNKRSKCR